MGLSCSCGRISREDDELEILKWPLVEKVGVTGDPTSEDEELAV